MYFDVSKFKDYGRLSGQKLDEIKAGARKEVDETKDAAEDFALWKKTKNEIIEFDSPWGRGRPGWHIECSAIALKYSKGRTIDIHGGARDLIFPHHENEIAQSEAATGKTFSKYWLHTGFLTVSGEKMSKSLGNFITVKDALERFHPMALRIFYLKSHYRSPVDYSEKNVGEAQEIYEKISNTMDLIDETLLEKRDAGSAFSFDKAVTEFYAAMENDFDTPLAFAALFRLIHMINAETGKEAIDKKGVSEARKELEKMLGILGIRIERKAVSGKKEVIKVAEEFGVKANTPEEAIEMLITLRKKARREKNFGLSDRIRAKLREAGIILEDKKEGARWRVV